MYLDDERLYLLLDRYLAGEASSTDAAAVQEWLAQDSDHPRLLDDLRLIRRSAADYGTHRDLYLDGEAYFQVAHDARRPLRVHTAASVTEDLGTAFAIRAYADQVATEVVVAEGRVALWRADTASASRPALLL